MKIKTTLLAALFAFIGFNSAGAAGKIEMQEYMIPSDTPGISLYVRNKHLAGMKKFTPAKTLLFVHGATYPAETAFDLSLGGTSWMEYIAARGYDVWLVDVRGYSKSTRPPEMAQAADQNPPVVRTDVAVRDVGSAVDFILKKRYIDKTNLMGWSWGTTLMGKYTSENNEKVNKLVLYAPQWIRKQGASLTDNGAALGAYRIVSVADAKNRWLTGVPESAKASLIPAGWFEKWADATFDTDPWGKTQSPKKLRATNGTVQDSREFWSAGKALYEPKNIRVPVMLVHAEWDADLPSYMMQEYFTKLENAPYKEMLEISEGTHTIIMEKNRMLMFTGVQQFLDHTFKPEK
ncbi:pimeloyl-ACP methyl ester carboxylesterase [Jezberella montanilacus]|uniref:Pimeloyl-ACP methyl ester carboxylesterase n=1 Tax=Jezberella montanilacus TaxID=323426 RepID=A0A2T0XBM3_9BURK|nr:alpha/beta fold hydrolase [Jezberella montanilacus]PRY96322.1 pimeloyl-ACP methyl ester carboxylesterase [Jezberella montanilacus]|eukprot:gene10418-10486_t